MSIPGVDQQDRAADETFLKRALAHADLNALRAALYQVTRDEGLVGLAFDPEPKMQGFSPVITLTKASEDIVREKALALFRKGPIAKPKQPSRQEAIALFRKFRNPQLPDEIESFALEELAFEDYSRDAHWSAGKPPEDIGKFRIIIIGAGIGGIAVGAILERLQIPYTIIERESDLGGTWWKNKYPDARVDIPSHVYQFTFEKNYPWPSRFATQAESHHYLKYVAHKYGIDRHIIYNTQVVSATWSEVHARWELKTSASAPGGVEQTLSANVVVSAAGVFNKPLVPSFEGGDTFKGKMFHSTSWDHSCELAGKRIALIGTGSSGVQLMPKMASLASKLTVFQREPHWIFPNPQYFEKITPEERWLFDNVPYYWNWYCYMKFEGYVQPYKMMKADPEWQKKGGLVSEANDRLRAAGMEYVKSKLSDRPDLLEKSISKRAPFGRRLVVDSGFYDALKRDNVELVPQKIKRIVPGGIETTDGVVRDFDVIVLCTGFEVSKFMWPVKYIGRDGMAHEKLWEKDGARAYLGMVMPGIPNFFMLYGPNGMPLGGDYYSWAEMWARYIANAVVKMVEGGYSSLECRKEVFDEYNARLDHEIQFFVWQTDGEGTYYVNEHGRAGLNMGFGPIEYYEMVKMPNPDDYLWRRSTP